MSALERSARVAVAREVLAEFRAAVADEAVPYDSAGWAGRLVAALEDLLAVIGEHGADGEVNRDEYRARVSERLTATEPLSDHLTDAAVDAGWPEIERLRESNQQLRTAASPDIARALGQAERERDEAVQLLENHKASLAMWQRNYQTVQGLINELCICDLNPETTQGPEHDCPVPGHGEEEHRPRALRERVQQAERERDELKAAVERVRNLHVRNANTGDCEHCSERDYPNYAVPWPCPTIAALGLPPADEGSSLSSGGGSP
jgi:hypothetical protein